MFNQPSVRTTFRSAAVLTVAATVEFGSYCIGMLEGAFVVFNVAARTAGSVAVTFQGSNDGTTWWSLPSSLSRTLSANGQTTIGLTAGYTFPKYVRATLTPSSFDGTLEMWTQTNGNPATPTTT